MRSRSAVLFDFDGTLTTPYLDFDAIRAEIGIPGGPILEAMNGMDETARRAADAILLRHEAEAAAHATLQDGAAEVLTALRQSGHPVGIVTRNARSTVNSVLSRFCIVVDGLRTREDGAVKPSPTPVLSLCNEFGAHPPSSWVVGDFLFDILSGQAAGAQTVLMIGGGVPPPYAGQANFVIRRLAELLPIMNR